MHINLYYKEDLMRLIILFLSLLSFLEAKTTINIDSNNSNIKDFEISYFIDTSNKLEFKDIKLMKFVKGKNQVCFERIGNYRH